MAFLYITEYEFMAEVVGGSRVPVGKEPPVASQRVPIPGTSAAFNARTKFVRLNCDLACQISPFAVSPAAVVAGDKRLSIDQTEYFGAVAGHSLIAAAVLP